MGMYENWQSYLNMTKAKAEAHAKAAQFWDQVNFVLNIIMIFLSAFTTLATLLPVSKYVASGLGAASTLVSSIVGFLNPSLKRQQQEGASAGFRFLMLKMVRVETEREYEDLWKEYNKDISGEPFLRSKKKETEDKDTKFKERMFKDTEFSMSPAFLLLIAGKEADMKERSSELGVDLAAVAGSADKEKPSTSSESVDKGLAKSNKNLK